MRLMLPLLLCALSAASFAQNTTPKSLLQAAPKAAQAKACDSFANTLCADKKDFLSRNKCLVANQKKLDARCLMELSKELNAQNPCAISVLALCPSATALGALQNLECLHKNVTKLPAKCKELLTQRAKHTKDTQSEFQTACGSDMDKLCGGRSAVEAATCLDQAYKAGKVQGTCKEVMDKYSAMRKNAPKKK